MIAFSPTKQAIPRYRSLAGLIALHEENYRRWARLTGGLGSDVGYATSVGADQMPVHLQRLDHQRYTDTWHMTYWFEDGDLAVPDPDIQVRVYHDAKLAETFACGRNEHCPFLKDYRIDAAAMFERRWQMSLLLNKWLEYLLARQHRFAPAETAA